jgi:primosomal protein N' (replication factor Y)
LQESDNNHQLQVAVPVPLRQVFDYLHSEPVEPGVRVLVPFGRRTLVGMVVRGTPARSSIKLKKIKLKKIKQVLDLDPVMSGTVMDLVMWSAGYYHYPVGEVIHAALPGKLRKPGDIDEPGKELVLIRNNQITSEEAIRMLARAPKQRMLYGIIPEKNGISALQIRESGEPFEGSNLTSLINSLITKELVVKQKQDLPPDILATTNFQETLNDEQLRAIRLINQAGEIFSSFVLHGVTGSGKTEVYLHAAQTCISRGQQVLVLVPEISLTPQLINRFRQRLGQGVYALHSNMPASKRFEAWWYGRSGKANVILGTRSAIFTPLRNPGLIIVDEEHDLSFKQLEGFRYHARDLAIKRASLESIPVVLGSATPSMESMNNVHSGRHQLLELNERTGVAKMPDISLVDLTKHPHQDGLSPQLLGAIGEQLKHKKQTILYINRRGFAPVAQCSGCGWQAKCPRCDAFMTVHNTAEEFRCHHCGSKNREVSDCPDCKKSLFYAGVGTQRVEQALANKFPEARILRFDRDEITSLEKLNHALDQINRGDVDIIIGTQLISKGHDFPGVTLVGVINSDQGLYSVDFRAPEYLVQQITQVAGRAGRGAEPGRVIIQTAHPDNPYLQLIHNNKFKDFYKLCSRERQLTGLPPYGFIAMWRAESTDTRSALMFLDKARSLGTKLIKDNALNGIMLMDPVSSPMEKLAGRYRAQLLIKSAERSVLHNLLGAWLSQIAESKIGQRVRWSLDIDPMDMF